MRCRVTTAHLAAGYSPLPITVCETSHDLDVGWIGADQRDEPSATLTWTASALGEGCSPRAQRNDDRETAGGDYREA